MTDFTNSGAAMYSLLNFMSPSQRGNYALLSSAFPQTLPLMQPQSLQSMLPMQGPTKSGAPVPAQTPLSPDFGEQVTNNYAAQAAAGNKNYGLSDAMGDSAGQYLDGAKQALSCCGE